MKRDRLGHPELSRQVKEDHDPMFGCVLFEEQEESAQVGEVQEKVAEKEKKEFHEPQHEKREPLAVQQRRQRQ